MSPRILLVSFFLALPSAASAMFRVSPKPAQPCKPVDAVETFPAGATVLEGDFGNTLPKTAYDCVNGVFLIVSGNPVRGRFVDEGGASLGAEFPIEPDEKDYNGWPTVAFGGSAFLVTYVVAGGRNPQYGRFVRWEGAPKVGARFKVADVEGEWYASERARSAWDGRSFIVPTRLRAPGAENPHVELRRVEPDGKVSEGRRLTDGERFAGSPSLACSPGGVCLAVGFSPTAAWARRFDARTLEPLGELLTLDDGSSRTEDHGVLFNERAGKFLASWWRAGFVDTRVVGVDGSQGPLVTAKSFGPDAGDVAVSYNPFSGTTLLVTKWSPPGAPGADLFAVELDDRGLPVESAQPVHITRWDEKVKAYFPSVAAAGAPGRWLVLYGLADGGHAAFIQGSMGGPKAAAAKRKKGAFR